VKISVGTLFTYNTEVLMQKSIKI